MKEKEVIHIILAIAVLALISGFRDLIESNILAFSIILGASAIVIGVNLVSKKLAASRLDADVEHELWKVERYGLKPGYHLDKPIFAGIIVPIFVAIVTLGSIKFMTLLTYETRALKRRAAKRFGPYSFTEMTDFHNALVGAAGIVGCLLVTFVTYWFDGQFWELLGRMATFYAFFNLIPISKLDGSQIFFGSRPWWAVLVVITLIFMMYAMLLV